MHIGLAKNEMLDIGSVVKTFVGSANVRKKMQRACGLQLMLLLLP
jgi:hypothetical protein